MIYAIGDIHGHLDKLKSVHERIAADAKGRAHSVIHIGDLIDRGPASKGVIEFLIKGQAKGRDWRVIKGNHDSFLPAVARSGDPNARGSGAPKIGWYHERVGGLQTVESFGGNGRERGDELRGLFGHKIIDWIDNLPYLIRIGDYVFVHAGINPERAIDDQIESDLMWIRDPFLNFDGDFGALIIHGHTPVDAIERYRNRINIDTGAGYGRALSAIVIDGDEIYALTSSGRAALPILPAYGS